MTGRPAPRSRAHIAGLLVACTALGLATRQYSGLFPGIVARYGGDALWAGMVYWVLALWHRAAATHLLAVRALAVATAVEVSQLYHAPWIDALRATRLGALLLGHGFLWSDLASYVVGVALAAAIDWGVVPRMERSRGPSRG